MMDTNTTTYNESAYRFHVQFHITNCCNLNCRHCYEGGLPRNNHWQFDEFKEAINKLWEAFRKWGVLGEISLIGGEPTMHPDYYKIVDYLHSKRRSHLGHLVAYLSHADDAPGLADDVEEVLRAGGEGMTPGISTGFDRLVEVMEFADKVQHRGDRALRYGINGESRDPDDLDAVLSGVFQIDVGNVGVDSDDQLKIAGALHVDGPYGNVARHDAFAVFNTFSKIESA